MYLVEDVTPAKSPNTYNTPLKSIESNKSVKSPKSFNNYYLKSPIGKILVENYDPLTSVRQNYSSVSSFQTEKSTPVEKVTTYKRALFLSEPPQKSIKGIIIYFFF